MILLFCFVTPPGLEPGFYLSERYVLSCWTMGPYRNPTGIRTRIVALEEPCPSV